MIPKNIKQQFEALSSRDVNDVTKMGNDQLNDHKRKVKKAYRMFVIACQDKVSFILVQSSKSRDFPQGDARLVWSKLEKKF